MQRDPHRPRIRQPADRVPNQLFDSEFVAIERRSHRARRDRDCEFNARLLHFLKRQLSPLFQIGYGLVQGGEQLLNARRVGLAGRRVPPRLLDDRRGGVPTSGTPCRPPVIL